MGRGSAEMSQKWWEELFSDRGRAQPVEETDGDLGSLVSRARRTSDGDLARHGSGDISPSLVESGEVRLSADHSSGDDDVLAVGVGVGPIDDDGTYRASPKPVLSKAALQREVRRARDAQLPQITEMIMGAVAKHGCNSKER